MHNFMVSYFFKVKYNEAFAVRIKQERTEWDFGEMEVCKCGNYDARKMYEAL